MTPETWLLTEGSRLQSTSELLCRLAEFLRATGIPIVRVWYGCFRLHPHVAGSAVTWRFGVPVEAHQLPVMNVAFSERLSVISRAGPMRDVLGPNPVAHVPLTGDEPAEWDLNPDLRRLGCTYLVALQLFTEPLLSGTLTFATNVPGGLTQAQVALIVAMRPALGLVLHLLEQATVARTLLAAYLGASPAERVLAGQIRRGLGERVPGVVWVSDLRGFTAMSETLPGEALLETLSVAFEAQVGGIEEAGGTVLKFMGDGVLALFPAHGDPSVACEAALRAVRVTFVGLAACNAAREAAGEAALALGVGLHFGEVMYGNIGSSGRLDFTVVGPAVNRAARLEGLGATLGVEVIASAEFAAWAGEPMEELGALGLIRFGGRVDLSS